MSDGKIISFSDYLKKQNKELVVDSNFIEGFFILENCPDKLLPSLRAYLWIQVLNFDTAIWYQHQTFTGTLGVTGRVKGGKTCVISEKPRANEE